VAEGVETEAEAATLLDLGCTVGQGYLVARPMPIGDVTSLVALSAVFDAYGVIELRPVDAWPSSPIP
jgi:predicted signal transduction protein with EAL and GGDEF domain